MEGLKSDWGVGPTPMVLKGLSEDNDKLDDNPMLLSAFKSVLNVFSPPDVRNYVSGSYNRTDDYLLGPPPAKKICTQTKDIGGRGMITIVTLSIIQIITISG